MINLKPVMPGLGAMPKWAETDAEAQMLFLSAKAQRPELSDEEAWGVVEVADPPCWAERDSKLKEVFVQAKAEFLEIENDVIWNHIQKEITAMGDPNQYLGNDSEVVNLPADQGSDPNAGWGSDDAVVEVPTEK